MALTTTDYIGIGVLITTFFSALGNFVNGIRIKDIHTLVNSQSTAQNTLIDVLKEKIVDKDKQLSKKD